MLKSVDKGRLRLYLVNVSTHVCPFTLRVAGTRGIIKGVFEKACQHLFHYKQLDQGVGGPITNPVL